MSDIALTESRLLHYANWYVASRGYRFGPGAENDITWMTKTAAQQIHSGLSPGLPGLSDPELDREFKTRTAEAAFSLFIDQMIAAWPEVYSPGDPAIVGEKTFAKAKAKLCPLWPIC